jgi:hypothetical protein
MLRRIPATPLVCLVVFLSTFLFGAACAAGPDESLEVLLKPDKQGAAHASVVKATPRHAAKYRAAVTPAMIPYPPPGICKVKPVPAACAPFPMNPPCILATPQARQWEMGVQVFFARMRGTIAYPRYPLYGYAYWWATEGADLVDHLQLPKHDPVVELSAKYQFRPNWAIKYTGLYKEFTGGGTPSDYFWFGNQYGGSYYYYGQSINSKWQHSYQTVSLVYDAIRTCNSKVSVFGGWMHADDRIDVGCLYCGNYTQTFSKSMDGATVGVEVSRCLKTMPNGGTFSCDYKVAAMFLDNIEGWDVQAGARYSIPLNAGNRWGYVKGGYRLIDMKKSQNDFSFKHALEGGFVEMGFIF